LGRKVSNQRRKECGGLKDEAGEDEKSLRFFFPKQNAKTIGPGSELEGELRDLSKIDEDKWELKITMPGVSMYSNLYIRLSDEEIEALNKWIKEA
jgi:hypothetical protein